MVTKHKVTRHDGNGYPFAEYRGYAIERDPSVSRTYWGAYTINRIFVDEDDGSVTSQSVIERTDSFNRAKQLIDIRCEKRDRLSAAN